MQNAAHLLTILSWVLLFIIGTVVMSVFVVSFMGEEAEKSTPAFWGYIAAVFMLCAILIWTSKALMKHRQWAKYAGCILGAAALIAFPVGTVLGLFILGYIHKGWHER